MSTKPEAVELEKVVIKFAGDSGDGMQLTGTQFSDNTAIFGNDLATLPFSSLIKRRIGQYGRSCIL